MTYIPDCRTDENYNYGKLNSDNQVYVSGFDHCVEDAVKSFFYNLECYYGADSYFMHLLNEKVPQEVLDDAQYDDETIETYGDLFKTHLFDWIEGQRDELITSLIDGQWESKEDPDE